MILHTVNSRQALAKCLSLLHDDDIVVLIEDGVFLGNETFPGKRYLVDIDADARGVVTPNNDQRIDHARFVALCTEAEKVCSWF